MSSFDFRATRFAHLRIVLDHMPGLRSVEMRDIITTAAEKRLRRIRMDLEDEVNAIRVPSLASSLSPIKLP
ncbi:hypothetical protein [Aureimonas ureilytica]|uniref:hypothetical protein n=1 Tax=Aureimonas ureilytica TaxID=401562 RepID=UPI00035C4584|nr:hypothetical protein [Aureimonas ureilytica]